MHLLVSTYTELAAMAEECFTCGLDAALAVMAGKWKPLILFHLAHGPRRYGALKRAIGGVSDKVLIQQLKELDADGIVDRADYGEIPPKVEYSVTPFGKTLAKALVGLCEWGTKHTRDIEAIVERRKEPKSPGAAASDSKGGARDSRAKGAFPVQTRPG